MGATKPNVSVVVKKDEPVERALRRFKRLCERAGITKTVRSKRYYEKPSDVRRREVRKSLRNRRRAERKAKERMQRKLDRARKQQRAKIKATQQPAPIVSDVATVAAVAPAPAPAPAAATATE